MRKIYVTYKQGDKVKKAVLDENMYKVYKANPEIKDITEYENEMLMEKAYAGAVGSNNKKTLLG